MKAEAPFLLRGPTPRQGLELEEMLLEPGRYRLGVFILVLCFYRSLFLQKEGNEH